MKIFMRDSKYHVYLCYEGRMLRKSLKTSNKRLAQDLAKEIEYKLYHEGWGFLDRKAEQKAAQETQEKLRFSKFFEEIYFPYAKTAQKKPLGKNTQVAVYGKFRRHLRPFFLDTPLNQITSNQIDDYKKKRVKEVDEWREKKKIDWKGYSSINRELTILRTVLNYAVKKNYIAVHPFSKRQVDFFEEKMDFGQAITREEETRLLNCATERLKPLILMALYTGRRKGEILNLTWQQVDLNNKVIKFDDTKENQTVEVPLTNQLTTFLESAKMNKVSGYVFCHHTRDSYRGLPYNNIDKWWLQARRDAGLIKPFKKRNLRFHDLRHSFVSRARELGFSDSEVMELTGHKELDTLRRYTHPTNERKRMMVQLLEINTEKTCTNPAPFSNERISQNTVNAAIPSKHKS